MLHRDTRLPRREKDPDEIALLQQCMRVAEAGHAWARAHIKPGFTELQVYEGVFAACSGAAKQPVIVYGDFAVSPGPVRNAPGPIQRARELTAPILGLFGGADDGIPPETVTEFDTALTDAGVRHEIVTYPGAPHGFFDQSLADEYADACADVWRRVLAFLSVLA